MSATENIRPMCSQCQAKHTICIYRQILAGIYQNKLETLQALHPAVIVYCAIQTRLEAEVHEIIRRIQADANAETMAHQLSTADLLP
jgi:hypothetical protein